MDDDSDWGFLPPSALQLIGVDLPVHCLLRARLVCKHWQHVFAPVIGSITVVPEAFPEQRAVSTIATAFPKASNVLLDLQDTFTTGTETFGASQSAGNTAAALRSFTSERHSLSSSVPSRSLVTRSPSPPAPISTTPLPHILGRSCTQLRVRLPDSHDIQHFNADPSRCWDYVSAVLSTHGAPLTSLTLSTTPALEHIHALAKLTQLTSLALEDSTHTVWGVEHASVIATLTNLCSLTVKIPVVRSRLNEHPPGSTPGLLTCWTSLTQLTRLHITAMRYNYHASLVQLLPHLSNLTMLAIKAPTTRIPWPGTDQPLFPSILALPALTHLCLSLIDHVMSPSDWLTLTHLTRLSHLELTGSEAAPGMNMPSGLALLHVTAAKLRYPNSMDLVRVAGWTSLQRLDLKFSKFETALHQVQATARAVAGGRWPAQLHMCTHDNRGC
ncbi:MAG: hypothetical protein WDW38_008827 [Sanguina aurantia]